jgi:disulfide bond formation protein DsbB
MNRFVPALLAALVLSGCGGPKKDETSPAPAEPPAAAPAAQPTPAAAPEGDAAAGKDQFIAYCSSCHGPDAKGLKGLGKDLTVSEFVGAKSDAELLAFVKTGRPVGDPLNTTNIPMPPKGGNPALTDQEIANILAYVRTLRK